MFSQCPTIVLFTSPGCGGLVVKVLAVWCDPRPGDHGFETHWGHGWFVYSCKPIK